MSIDIDPNNNFIKFLAEENWNIEYDSESTQLQVVDESTGDTWVFQTGSGADNIVRQSDLGDGNIEEHLNDTSNPHEVTVDQINAPTQSEFDTLTSNVDDLQSTVESHTSDTNNPHGITYSQVDALPLASKGTSGGVAELDSNQKIPESQIPSIAIVDTFIVQDEAEMTSLDAQRGDVAIREDEHQSYILQVDDPSLVENWKVLKSPTNAVDSVFGRTGSVTGESGDYHIDQITEGVSQQDLGTVESDLSDHISSDNPHPESASESWVSSNFNDYSDSDVISAVESGTLSTLATDELNLNSNTVALGSGSDASGNYSVALGYNSAPSGNYSVAIGRNASTSGINSTAIGRGATSSNASEGVLGVTSSDYGPSEWKIPGSLEVGGIPVTVSDDVGEITITSDDNYSPDPDELVFYE